MWDYPAYIHLGYGVKVANLQIPQTHLRSSGSNPSTTETNVLPMRTDFAGSPKAKRIRSYVTFLHFGQTKSGIENEVIRNADKYILHQYRNTCLSFTNRL